MIEPPASAQFRGKTWIFLAQAVVFGSLALFALLMGPLFLSGALKRVDGKPAQDAGIALIAMGVVLSLPAALAIFNIVARRQPVVSLYREGIAVNLIGVSSLDHLPPVPGFSQALSLLRLAWLILSLQGFKQQLVYAPWGSFGAAQVSGLTMQRTLTIIAPFFRPGAEGEPPTHITKAVSFAEAAFAASLDQIARTLTTYALDARARQKLPSWRD